MTLVPAAEWRSTLQPEPQLQLEILERRNLKAYASFASSESAEGQVSRVLVEIYSDGLLFASGVGASLEEALQGAVENTKRVLRLDFHVNRSADGDTPPSSP